MKLMTLHEPWATLMATQEKKIETRGWSTPYRGLVAIHSAKAGLPMKLVREICSARPFSDRLLYQTGCVLPDFHRGHVIAVGWLYDDKPVEMIRFKAVNDPEFAFGDYTFGAGRHGFFFGTMFKLPRPIPYRSRQGGRRLLDAPLELVTQIRAQLPELASGVAL